MHMKRLRSTSIPRAFAAVLLVLLCGSSTGCSLARQAAGLPFDLARYAAVKAVSIPINAAGGAAAASARLPYDIAKAGATGATNLVFNGAKQLVLGKH